MSHAVSIDVANHELSFASSRQHSARTTSSVLDAVNVTRSVRQRGRSSTYNAIRSTFMPFFPNQQELDASARIEMGPLSAEPASLVDDAPSTSPVGDANGAEAAKSDVAKPAEFEQIRSLVYHGELGREAAFALNANLEAIDQLSQEYQYLCGLELKTDFSVCRKQIRRFHQKLNGFKAQIRILQSRVELHLAHIADRKGYIHAILQQRNLQSSHKLSLFTKEIAEDAQSSTRDMQKVTKDMHIIAKRTEKETVRMRIITVVTLFFLPGTFVSTLMSTAVVKFPEPPEGLDTGLYDAIIGIGALQLYVILSVPLMCLTFFSWFLLHRVEPYLARIEAQRVSSHKKQQVA